MSSRKKTLIGIAVAGVVIGACAYIIKKKVIDKEPEWDDEFDDFDDFDKEFADEEDEKAAETKEDTKDEENAETEEAEEEEDEKSESSVKDKVLHLLNLENLKKIDIPKPDLSKLHLKELRDKINSKLPKRKSAEEASEQDESEFKDEEPKAYEVDLNGDGKADAVAIDADGDGTIDAVAADTTGDGVADTAYVDTTGDGILDTEIKLDEDTASDAAPSEAKESSEKPSET